MKSHPYTPILQPERAYKKLLNQTTYNNRSVHQRPSRSAQLGGSSKFLREGGYFPIFTVLPNFNCHATWWWPRWSSATWPTIELRLSVRFLFVLLFFVFPLSLSVSLSLFGDLKWPKPNNTLDYRFPWRPLTPYGQPLLRFFGQIALWLRLRLMYQIFLGI